MTDEEIQQYLDSNGFPEHVVAAGRAGLLARYRQFVEEVERGYEFSLRDYRADLDGRATLHIAGLDDEVADLDARLEAQLVNREMRVWESAAGDPFWDFGHPGKLMRPLRRGLASAGLLTEE